MKVVKLREAIELLKENGGPGLMAMDVFGDDGLSLAGFNTNPQACALFNRIFGQVIKSLKGSGFPSELNYYVLMLDDKKCVLVGKIEGSTYLYGMLINTTLLQLGLLLNVVIPDFLESLKEAL